MLRRDTGEENRSSPTIGDSPFIAILMLDLLAGTTARLQNHLRFSCNSSGIHRSLLFFALAVCEGGRTMPPTMGFRPNNFEEEKEAHK